ncbi:MAG: MBL fold metallo-hydrolase [Bacteroidales bacterium]|nr:MBL fold metallo-hydrolase [Bacteroidales bacterium]
MLLVLSPIIYSHAQFGAVPRGERLRRISMSAHFVKNKFRNSEPTVLRTGKISVKKIKDFILNPAENTAPGPGELQAVKTDLHQLSVRKGDLYVWFGHSSFLLRLSGKIILADPVFCKAAPFKFINRPFKDADIYRPEDMPQKIDFLLISHDHWDHLDYGTVKRIRDRVGYVVCPLGVGADLQRWGYPKDRIIELDWDESWTSDDSSITFTSKETRHFTGRAFWNPRTMPAAWYIKSPERNIFFSGDGGWGSRFERFSKEKLDIDLAIMENGQYNQMWNQIHTLPKYLGEEIRLLAPKRFVTVHHSKFRLSDHPWDEPLRNEILAEQETGVPLVRTYIGKVVEL